MFLSVTIRNKGMRPRRTEGIFHSNQNGQSIHPRIANFKQCQRNITGRDQLAHWYFMKIIFLKKIDLATAKLMKENEKNRIRICKVITTGCGDGTSLTDEMGEKKEIN